MAKKNWIHQPKAAAQSQIRHPSVAEMTLEARSFQGPLPHPEQLAQYAQISPAYADRIITMGEKEQESRLADAALVRRTQGKILTRGQIFGFILSLAIIVGGIMMIMADKPTSGFISIIAGIGTVAGPFLYRMHREKRQSE